MQIPVGKKHTVETLVDTSNVASAVGSGSVDVFATPMMVALMERAASECVADCLDEGDASVGTELQVSHCGATPIGLRVTATAKVVAAEGRRVDFDVVVNDPCGEVGRATHTRFVINKARFMEKALRKTEQAAPRKD